MGGHPVKSESAPAWGASADSRSEVESKSSAEERHAGRFANVTLKGMKRLPPGSFRLFDIGFAVGRYFDENGQFKRLGRLPLGSVVDPSRLPDVLEIAGVAEKTWENAVSSWVRLRMAHRCRPRVVALFVEPRDGLSAACLRCGAALHRGDESLPAPGNDSPGSREESSRLQGEFEHESLVASKVERDVAAGTEPVPRALESSVPVASQEGSSEVAAHVALKRAGVQIGEPMSDEEIRALGYQRTSRGWEPIKGASDAA
jgi:hypothetical protein